MKRSPTSKKRLEDRNMKCKSDYYNKIYELLKSIIRKKKQAKNNHKEKEMNSVKKKENKIK